MKNRLAIFIFLVICIQMTSQNMYHKQIDLPFNSSSNLRDILGKEFLQKYFFPDPTELSIGLFNHLNKESMYNDEKREYIIPVGKYTFGKFDYHLFSKIYYDDNENFIYENWIKSFSVDGRLIDSLQLSIYTSYLGAEQRMFSTITNKNEIMIDYWGLYYDEEENFNINIEGLPDINKKVNITGKYKTDNGLFIFVNDTLNPIFYTDYLLYGNSDLLESQKKKCTIPLKRIFYDFDDNLIADLIVLEKNNFKCDKSFDYILKIHLSNNYGLYDYHVGEDRINLDRTKYIIDNISVEDNCLYLSIINNATKEQFRIYLTQDKNKNTCIQSVSKIKNNEIIKVLKFEIGKKYLNKLTTIIEEFDK